MGAVTQADQGAATVNWSFSRRGLLERCPRQYYYSYYGASDRFATDEPMKPMLMRLRAMDSIPLRLGSLAHLTISTFLKHRQAGARADMPGLTRWAVGLLYKDAEYSEADPDGQNPPPGRYPPRLLREFNARDPQARQAVSDAAEALRKALNTFAGAQKLGVFRTEGAKPGALVEYPFRISILGALVSGRVDLAFRRDGSWHIVDWKTGAADAGSDDSLQLAVYALWARDSVSSGFEPATCRIEVMKCFLGSGSIVRFDVSEAVLDRARVRIAQDMERILEAHPYGVAANASAFSPCLQPRVCRQCSFQSVCPEGRELLDA